MLNVFISVRFVSDVVHMNINAKHKYQNIDDVVLGKEDFRNEHVQYHPSHNVSVREAVFHLSNYSLIWEEVTSVYPRVRNIKNDFKWLRFFSRIKFCY